jgi:hypothetical protein
MITSFEVGAVFKIINEASPTLLKILKQIRELNAVVDKAKASISSLAAAPGLAVATGETRALAVAWRDVGKAAASANRSIGATTKRQLAGPGVAGVAEAQSMASAWERIAVASAAATGNARQIASAARRGGGAGGGGTGGTGPGRHQPGFLASAGRRRSSGAHISGPYIPMPGGSHVNLGGGAMAAAGLLGYGAYEAAQMEDAVFQLTYHSGLEQNDATHAKFRKVLQDAMAESGYSLHDVAESAKQEIRMFQGTLGGGLDVLPEMLRAATIESRLKGSSPEESMRALIGLAHMTKQYSPEAIKKLAPAFAFLSTANPSSLSSMERAASYAVPILQSSLEIDPIQSLLLGTALTRAGATNSKSGTWLRNMALNAMPGTSMMSKMMFKKHEAALRPLGLIDDHNKPTWFTDGKPDLLKMLDIAGTHAANIPLEKRAAIEMGLFGKQGGGGFAMLANPAVREQVLSLRKTMDSPEFKNRYGGFVEAYKQGSTVQSARTGMAEFNITMQDLGKITLPAVNNALGNFKTILEGLRNLIPGGDKGAGAVVGGHAIVGLVGGAVAGATYGAFGGPFGAGVGALIGGVGGGVEGVAEQYIKSHAEQLDKIGLNRGGSYSSPGKTGKPAEKIVVTPPINLSLNIDGNTLGRVMSGIFQSQYTFGTGAAAADGVGMPLNPEHNTTDH